MSDKYCITHVEGSALWVLKEWVPGFWIIPFLSGEWRVLGTAESEETVKALMKQYATAITTTVFYDKHGDEDRSF